MKTVLVGLLVFAVNSVLAAEPAATNIVHNPPACSNVYLISPAVGLGSFNDSVKEISISVGSRVFETKGKLFRGDWGAVTICSEELTLRVRLIFGGFRFEPPAIKPTGDDIKLKLVAGMPSYYVMGVRWQEINQPDGIKMLADISNHSLSGRGEPTGWEWKDRRELVYGPGSPCFKEETVICP
jgi:hypothetical protein